MPTRKSQDSTTDLIQYASVTGELAPNLWGRTDFEKYDSGWAEAKNWAVDYRGGLFSRAGFEFGDIIEWVEGARVRFFEFQFSPDTTNTYVVVATDSIFRFVQDNAYVLEADVSIASVANVSTTRIRITTGASHGYSDGDWVKLSGFTDATLTFLNNRTVYVDSITATTFDIKDPADSGTSYIEKASISTDTGTVNRIYTVVSPYDTDDLERLQGKQIRDTIRFTHPDYAIRNLTRTSHASWTLATETIGSSTATVTGLTRVATNAAENRTFVYQVTAIDEFGDEGLPDIYMSINGGDLVAEASDWNTISWTEVAGAVRYNIYRSDGVNDSTGVRTQSDSPVGYIGYCTGHQFTDPGITPDYSRQPPAARNPFANGRIRYVTVDVDGTGFAYDDTITWPAGGTGAYGFVVCDGAGASTIDGIKVLDGGQDYTGTSVTVAGGSGETLTAVLSAATGNNPHCSALFLQRMVYGATDQNPLTIFGSRPGLLSNFNITDAGSDDDAYELELDAEQIAPIRHLKPVRGGLLVFNQSGVWLMYGKNSNIFSANNAQIDPQNDVGATYVPPINVDSYVLYASAEGQEMRLLAYDDYSKVFEGQNVSLLSNHLYSPDDEILSLTYAPTPHKVAYGAQNSGRLLSMTIDRINGVYACTPNDTQGYFRTCLAIRESNESRLYVAVERVINGNTVLYFERQKSRSWPTLEDSFCVDAGLDLTKTAPAGRLVPSSLTGSVTFTVTGATPFVSGDVGKVIRCGSGKATISGFTSSSIVTGTWNRDLEETFPGTTNPAHFRSGAWWMDSTTTTISGLWHLIGESLAVLADGAVITGKTVDTNGEFTLSTAASRVAAGLAYTCTAKTLPLTVEGAAIEGRVKDIVGVSLRINETAGLKIGAATDELFSIHDRAQVLWGTADRLRDTIQYEFTNTDWSEDNQIFFVQDTPRPATILSFIRDVDVGDDKY